MTYDIVSEQRLYKSKDDMTSYAGGTTKAQEGARIHTTGRYKIEAGARTNEHRRTDKSRGDSTAAHDHARTSIHKPAHEHGQPRTHLTNLLSRNNGNGQRSASKTHAMLGQHTTGRLQLQAATIDAQNMALIQVLVGKPTTRKMKKKGKEKILKTKKPKDGKN